MTQTIKPTPRRRHGVTFWIGIGLVAAIVGVYILLPVGFGIAAVFPARGTVGAPPEGFRSVALTAEDGAKLAAWYRPPANGVAIILLHGAGGTREEVRQHAAMLARHGYGVLALDMRGAGESGGATNRFGWQGTRDVGAAVSFLAQEQTVKAIGGWGLSLGGEVLLGASSAYPAMRAIVADGATQRSLAELCALPSERPLVRNWVTRVLYATVQALTFTLPPQPPLLEAMVAASGTRFLLVAGGAKAQEVRFNELFAATVGERATLWVAPEVPHVGAFARYPQEYEQRVLALFGTLRSP